MKFYLPVGEDVNRYSFRSRGTLLLENMPKGHGSIESWGSINTHDIFVFGKKINNDLITHLIEKKIKFIIDVSDWKPKALNHLYVKSGPHAKAFVATCDYLADLIGQVTERKVHVIQDPTERKQVLPIYKEFNKNSVVNCLWYGGRKNLNHFEVPKLEANLKKVHPNAHLTILTNKKRDDPDHWVDWSFEKQNEMVANTDFVIIPTSEREKHLEHVRSKGNNRPIDAIRQGKFVITTTTIPSYVELKDYLYAGDILRGFKFALQNPKMVYEKILKGQEYIRNFYEPKQIANKWLELERKIISEESI